MSQITNNMTLCTAKENEMIYTYRQSQQIKMITGYVGYLRGDFGSNGNEFYSSWMDEISERKTPEFQSEFDEVINALRDDPKYRGILRNLEDMKLLCSTRPQSHIPNVFMSDSYAFRVNTEKYAYLIRCIPHKNDYNFCITAYEKDSLDRHIKNAEKGIRFINSSYKKLFMIPDGDKIQITFYDGRKELRTCRYIDEYHTEVGDNLYHNCQFAEIMENNGNSVIPMRSSLPEQCYAFVESENLIAIVKKGNEGYYPTKLGTEDVEKNKATVKLLNLQSGITFQQAEAMKAGSMFGWNTPAADPKNYDENGTPIKPNKRINNRDSR
ncbi:MAG: hypothetical protein ACLUFN_02085 [Eubacterium sp.]